jgi:hypothetical protein
MADVGPSTTASRLVQIVLVVLGLVGLYYLYIYLFAASISPTILLQGKTNAQGATALTVGTSSLPPIYMGGEFSISTWINVNNWSYMNGQNKAIIQIGNPNTFDTIRVYLGGQAAQLMIRFSTIGADTASGSSDFLANTGSNSNATAFASTNVNVPLETISDLTGHKNGCDVLQVDMQRWIHLVIAVNGMTSDVYLDGKLVRSCVLDNYFQVDPAYSAKLLGNGGFGGYISNTQIYGQSLSPDVVYQTYMAGPQPINNFWDYLTSFFSPSASY